MHRIEVGFPKLAPLFLALLFGLLAAVAPAVADDSTAWEGEPTDPEGALALAEDYEIDLSGHGLSDTVPRDDVDSWFADLLDLLRALGILAPEGSGS